MNKIFSTLETLPVELLEKIFFYSLNFNLPRMLPNLAASLSSERVYRLLILLAFWDNDHDHVREHYPKAADRIFGGQIPQYGGFGKHTWSENQPYDILSILQPLGRDYVPLTPDERAALQSDILQCPWCTNDRIRRQLPDLAKLIISRVCINAGYMLVNKDHSRDLEERLYSEDAVETHEYAAVRMDKKRSGQHGEETKDEDEDEYPRCRITVRVSEYVVFEFESTKRDYWMSSFLFPPKPFTKTLWFPVLSILAIPPPLFGADIAIDPKGVVRDFLSDPHLSLLETLRFSGQLLVLAPSDAFPKISHSRQALQQGIHIALSTINLRALDIFLKFDVFFYRRLEPCYMFPSDHFRIPAQLYISITDTSWSLTRSVGNPGIEGIQDAALLLFCFLLFTSAESVPCDDPVVKRFALVEGSAFGKWLLDWMEVLPRHLEEFNVNDDHETMFSLRETSALSMGLRFENEVMRKRELFKLPYDSIEEDVWRYGYYVVHF